MGKGRAPCCDKTKVKKGPWSPAEDLRLTNFIQSYGHSNWRALPKRAGLLRCGKSCRLRWINYLRPDIKRGNFTPQEEHIIINLHNSIGNKWSKMASYLPGRTDNEIKNVWNTHLKKRLKNKGTTDHCTNKHESKKKDSKPNNSTSASPSCTSSSITLSEDPNTAKALVNQETQQSQSGKPNEDSISDNPSPTSSYGKIEILPESDIDFWELFGSLDTNQGYPDVNPEEKLPDSHESECSKWFRVLENELGLNCDVDSSPEDQNNVPTTLEQEIGSWIGLFSNMALFATES